MVQTYNRNNERFGSIGEIDKGHVTLALAFNSFHVIEVLNACHQIVFYGSHLFFVEV